MLMVFLLFSVWGTRVVNEKGHTPQITCIFNYLLIAWRCRDSVPSRLHVAQYEERRALGAVEPLSGPLLQRPNRLRMDLQGTDARAVLYGRE